MKLLVDHNLPPKLARALHIIFEPADQVVALRDKFGRSDLTDEEWIVRLGKEGGWAVLSKDLNIAKRKQSRDLFVGAGLVGFFFSPSLQRWELSRQCARVLTIWPQMVSHTKTAANGVFEIRASGSKFPTIGR